MDKNDYTMEATIIAVGLLFMGACSPRTRYLKVTLKGDPIQLEGKIDVKK